MTDLDAARRDIEQLPELFHHLAHLVTPGRLDDGQPRAKDLRAAPGRIAPLDDLDAAFAGLWSSAQHWRSMLGRKLPDSYGQMIRRDASGRVLGPRRTVTRDDAAEVTGHATMLVNRHVTYWRDIEAWSRGGLHQQHAVMEWLDTVHEWATIPIRRWPLEERVPVPEQGRECPVCGEDGIFTRWVDAHNATMTCAACEKVSTRKAWMLIDDAAKVLDVSPRTIRDWIKAGLPYRPSVGKGRMVEITAARDERDMRAYRKALNLSIRRA